ncbi:MAG: hypothetical protein GF313_04065 [Caldithrix sp.]|nr:hypothetical protein [Caldithrix sp.]
MDKRIAVVILTDTETPENLGRMANALSVAKDYNTHGYTVKIIFDGAAVKWVGKVIDPHHQFYEPFQAVKTLVKGACNYCSGAYGVREQVKKAGIPLLQEFEGHPSLRQLVDEGYQILTF